MQAGVGCIPVHFEGHSGGVVRGVVCHRTLKHRIDAEELSELLKVVGRRNGASQLLLFVDHQRLLDNTERQDFEPWDRLKLVVVSERNAGAAQGRLFALITEGQNRNRESSGNGLWNFGLCLMSGMAAHPRHRKSRPHRIPATRARGRRASSKDRAMGGGGL